MDVHKCPLRLVSCQSELCCDGPWTDILELYCLPETVLEEQDEMHWLEHLGLSVFRDCGQGHEK